MPNWNVELERLPDTTFSTDIDTTHSRVGSPVFAVAIAVTVPMKTTSFFEIFRPVAFPIPTAAVFGSAQADQKVFLNFLTNRVGENETANPGRAQRKNGLI